MDWSSQDWDGEKAKAREQKSLIDFMPPKPDTDQQTADATVDRKETVMTGDIPFQKLTIQSDNPDEESPEISDALIPLLEVLAETPWTDTMRSDGSTETHYESLTEQELTLQREEVKYAIYTGMLNKEEESDTETNTDETFTHILTKKNEHILEASDRTLKIVNFTFSGILIFAVCT